MNHEAEARRPLPCLCLAYCPGVRAGVKLWMGMGADGLLGKALAVLARPIWRP